MNTTNYKVKNQSATNTVISDEEKREENFKQDVATLEKLGYSYD